MTVAKMLMILHRFSQLLWENMTGKKEDMFCNWEWQPFLVPVMLRRKNSHQKKKGPTGHVTGNKLLFRLSLIFQYGRKLNNSSVFIINTNNILIFLSGTSWTIFPQES